MRSDLMKKLVLLALLAGLAACNTVAGLGEDISGGARATQDILN
jgi:predicted small secreted protein